MLVSLTRHMAPGKEMFVSMISRAHSFPRKNLTNSAGNFVNSAENFVNSAAHRGNTYEIPQLHR